MTSIWRSLPVVLVAGLWARAARAQEAYELGVEGLATTAEPTAWTAGAYGALRVSHRIRLAATLGAGVSKGQATGRGELLAHFLLSPGLVRGPAAYVGGGLAGVAGPVDQGYLVLLIGVEGAPGGRSGWMAEAGVGGGFRFAVGWRWRWRSAHPRT